MDVLKYGDKGPRVKALQQLLNNNKFFKPRRPLVADGEFGPLTTAAVQRGKRRLGYLEENVEPVAGPQFIAFLSGDVPLKPEMLARRKARLAVIQKQHDEKSAETKLRLRALEIIKGELGTREAPNHSNNVPYNTWWGWGKVAYCVIGVSWAWVKAGSTAFKKGARWANTDAMLEDAQHGRNGLHLTNDPDPGCPGVIDFSGHTDPDHAITFVKDNGDGTATTFEFNTTVNGVEGVWTQRRPLAQCWWFVVEH